MQSDEFQHCQQLHEAQDIPTCSALSREGRLFACMKLFAAPAEVCRNGSVRH